MEKDRNRIDFQRKSGQCWNGRFSHFCYDIILKLWPNGLASQRTFTKPELAYGLTKGGPTDSQVDSKVHASRKK